MNRYYEVKARSEKTMGDGMQKKVKETYLFDAMSFSEAEARAVEELAPFATGEFMVTDIKRAGYTELFPSEAEAADKWYAVRINFITLDERNGKEKKTKAEYLVQAAEINHARTSFIEGMKGTLADYEIVSIKETPILDVYTYVEKGGGQ